MAAMNITDPPVASRSLEQKVRIACLQEQYAKSPLPALGVCSVSMLCAVPGWFYLPRSVVVGYLLAMFGYQGLMLGLSQWVYRQRGIGLSLQQVAWASTAIYAVSGVAIGVSSVVLYRIGGEPMFLFVVLVQLGLAAGSLGTSAYHPPSMLAYLLPAMGIFIGDLLLHDRSFTVNVVVVGLIFDLFYVIVMGHEQSRSIHTAVRLTFQNDDLLRRLQVQTEVAQAARRQVERDSEYKSRFFASASHDLRQPVHALNVYTSLLNSVETEAERDEIVERIGTCVATLDDLFGALLTVSRAEDSTEEQVGRTPQPLQGIFDNVLHQFGPLAEQKGLSLHVVPTSVWVSGDRLALERLLSNLVSNAIRFTPQGKVRIGVRRRALGKVSVQVLDTGIGIDPALRDRIFEEFFQAANPGRHADRGFGLGLVIVSRLARALDYRVSVDSRPGRGSCFSVLVPQVPEPTQASVHPQPAASGRFSSPISLLLVDDDPLVRDALTRLFADWQVEADVCGSSHEAYALAREQGNRWDCLLLDQRLDEVTTGVELADQLRGLLHRDLPVALLTGEDIGPWTLEAQARSFTVLHKPVKMIRLRAFIAASANQSRR